MHRECWHTWATLMAEAYREWFSWAGAAVTLAGGPRLAGRLGPRNF